VYDGPIFGRPVPFTPGTVESHNGYLFLMLI